MATCTVSTDIYIITIQVITATFIYLGYTKKYLERAKYYNSYCDPSTRIEA